ncbi:MAG: DUF3467 domain-containing protein [Candidatus Binatia bacterium]
MMDKDTAPQQANPLEGRYANTFQVGYNAFEFVLDFGQVSPGNEEARFYTRIITSPAYAKALLETLRESIARYEQAFGDIPKSGGWATVRVQVGEGS